MQQNAKDRSGSASQMFENKVVRIVVANPDESMS
jgi:hypothetical protein